MPVVPPVYRPNAIGRSLQPKAPAVRSASNRTIPRAPAVPPVYRPQPGPNVLQRTLHAAPVSAPARFALPPVYRPQLRALVQPKPAAMTHKRTAPSSRLPVLPPAAYRPRSPQIPRPFTAVANNAGRAARGPAVVQRAITVGTQPLPRSSAITAEVRTYLQKEGIEAAFLQLNDDRYHIYIFTSDQHLVTYLKELAGQLPSGSASKPFVHTLSQTLVQQGHELAQDVRFTNIYEPSPNQFPENAPGVHNISPPMLPPPRIVHHYMHWPSTQSGGQQYFLFLNQFTGQAPTLPITYGDPNSPSLVMNQGGLNLGMHFNPTFYTNYYEKTARSKTTYGGISSETDRVRGHPFALEQTQYSTDFTTT